MVLRTCYVDSMSQVFTMYLIFMTFHHMLHQIQETYISMVPDLWTFLCRTSESCVKVRKLETSTPHCWCGEDVWILYSVHVCVSSVCAFRCVSTLTLPEDNLEWIICREASSIEAWLPNLFIHEPCDVVVYRWCAQCPEEWPSGSPVIHGSFLFHKFFIELRSMFMRTDHRFGLSLKNMCPLSLRQELTWILKHLRALVDNDRVALIQVPVTCYRTLFINFDLSCHLS